MYGVRSTERYYRLISYRQQWTDPEDEWLLLLLFGAKRINHAVIIVRSAFYFFTQRDRARCSGKATRPNRRSLGRGIFTGGSRPGTLLGNCRHFPTFTVLPRYATRVPLGR